MRTFRNTRTLSAAAAVSTLAFGLSACAGGAGGGSGDNHAGGEGFAYDAPQSEVDEVIADLDPMTITFQPSAASPGSVMAPAGTVFKELVEERSGGKITVEMVWGQAIAGYGEVHDALADGRLDVAYTLPVYQPDEFPAVNDFGTLLAGVSPSPFQGELIANAISSSLSWEQESILQSYEDKGLTPLTPVAASGGYYTVCNKPVKSADDWKGLQVRIASTAQAAQVTHLGGSPVSMEYTETFEALQRGTVDCTLGQLVPSAEAGIFEVAPHIGYFTETSISRSPGAYLAGSSFEDMPLAYQQIIFDSNALASSGGMKAVIDGNAESVKQAHEAGGEVAAFDDDVQKSIAAYNAELVEEAEANGSLSEGVAEAIKEQEDRWTKEFEELGFTDGGAVEDMDSWYDFDTDYKPYAEAVYRGGGAMEHRPGS